MGVFVGYAANVSIHAPHTGSDSIHSTPLFIFGCFNPRSPHGERHFGVDESGKNLPFQSTLPTRGATATRRHTRRLCSVSIHAPHTGSDDKLTGLPNSTPVSIHAPHTGSDVSLGSMEHFSKGFNPRSPHGERPWRSPPS